jgi:hypothetical protein
MLDASRAFDGVNHRPLEDPRVRVLESDGRNFLEYTQRQYDVIISEPSNPWIAGVASLFTVEHFTRARQKLKPGGLFCQWVQLYELRPENVARVFKTFRAAFPYVIAFSSMEKGTDLILIGANEPLRFTPAGWPRAFSDPNVAAELRRARVHHPADLYALAFLGDADFTPFIQRVEADIGHTILLNTDDNAILEAEAPRDLIRYKEADQFFSSIYYGDAIYGDFRPWLDPASTWSPRDLGLLARASFTHGKQALAAQLAQQALAIGPDPMAIDVARAWDLYQQGPEPFVQAQWPWPGSPTAALLSHAVHEGAELLALEQLYASAPRQKDLFQDHEHTLAAAFLFHRLRHDKRAWAQLSHLARQPGFLDQAPLARLLLAFSAARRTKYLESFQYFMDYDRAMHRPGAPATQTGLD